MHPDPSSLGPTTLLVIGVHRAELAFGDAVATHLDPARCSVLRIPDGLSGRRPRADQREAYRRSHDELYHQILAHLTPAHRLLIDLHTGSDETGGCADVLCHDPDLLARVTTPAHATAAPGPRIRGIRLVAPATAAPATADSLHTPRGARPGTTASWPIAHPDLPARVWQRADPLYVGVEVYLREEGAGSVAEQALAVALIERIMASAIDRIQIR